MLIRSLVWLAVFMALAMSPRRAEACSCRPHPEPCEAYWQAAAVFRGRVESIEYEPGTLPATRRPSTVTFTVLEPFRGVSGSTIAVWTAASGGTCGYRFAKGREYVVYAEQHRGRLMTSICLRTREVSRAEADLAYARAIAASTPLQSRVFGGVRMIVTDPSTGRSRDRPMPGIAVTLRGEATELTARTDRRGRFEFRDVPAGRYAPQVALRPGLRPDPFPAEVTLPDARACAGVDVTVTPDGRVRGRVTTAGGAAARGVTVELLVSSTGGALKPAAELRAATDRDGRYEIRGVPPGRFIAAVNLTDGSGDELRILDSGVGARSAARLAAVGPGDEVDVGTLSLPGAIALIEVSGLVVDGGRTPVEGARVYTRATTDRARIVGAPVTTDFAGGFTVSLVDGHQLELFAERQAGSDLDASDPVLVRGAPRAGPLILTLRRMF